MTQAADPGLQPGPSIWAVSDGRAGIERQSLSVARALQAPARLARLAHLRSDAHRTEPLRLQPSGLQLYLPANLWPSPLSALPPDQRAQLAPPWPDVWIATGRRSIPYSRLVRKQSGGRTLVVQTQDPKVSLETFDLVLPPEHDGVTGPNVFPLLGPPTFYPEADIAAARQRYPRLSSASGCKVLVSIGGDSRTHKMTGEKIADIEDILRTLAAEDMSLWITVSRRTPPAARALFRRVAAETGQLFWENELSDGPNPYLAWLSLCDAALVTEDSANMLADPAWFAKPVHILRLKGGSSRFDRLHQGFIDRGAARWFTGTIDVWTYEPVREVERAADEIVRLLLERRPA